MLHPELPARNLQCLHRTPAMLFQVAIVLVTCLQAPAADKRSSVTARGGKPPATVQFDFESGKLDGWEIIEGDLGRFLCCRSNWYDGKPFGKRGVYFLSTIETPAGPWNDGLTGRAESPVFVPAASEMSFLIGGGNKDSVYVSLCLTNGTELAKATGYDSHVMRRVTWQVPNAVGKQVVLRIVDQHRSSYGWLTFDDFRARGVIDQQATKQRRARWRHMRELTELRTLLGQLNFDSLHRMIDDLSTTFSDRFVAGAEYRVRLQHFQNRLAKIQDTRKLVDNIQIARQLLQDVQVFRREIGLANPLVRAQPILFVVRHQYARDHHNTETIFHTGEPNCGKYQPGGALKLLDPQTGAVTTLVDPGPEGVVRDPEVHFGGRKVVFSMRLRRDENYHVYEVGADGAGLRQLTFESDVTDIDPTYLPDDSIVFASTREPKYCMCNMHIMANLFRMQEDGANIHQLGKSTLFEGHPALLPDGRVLYYRWEYVDRNYGDAQGLWTMNPDGTNQAMYWGNNTASPGAVFDARSIPDSEEVVCIFGSCHDRPWGAMAVVDTRLGFDATSKATNAVVHIWPERARNLIGVGNWDTFRKVTPRYEDPYPLSEPKTGRGAGKYFLVSRATGREEHDAHDTGTVEMGIYLVDVFGNEILLHAETPGCYDPIPVRARPRPPVVSARRNFDERTGRFYLQNAYLGTHLQGVKPGDVAYLRVVESREKRFWTNSIWRTGMVGGESLNRPAVGWVGFECKRILGTVPVEADGSAYFEVPADRFVYFQLLDRHGMMISSMRSGTVIKPGETIGCVGCHEDRRTAPPLHGGNVIRALQRPPNKLAGWYGQQRTFNYAREVQPVFDKHCVSCHDFGKPAGKKLNLAGDKTLFFNVSYHALFQGWRTNRALIDPIGAGPTAVLPAYSWGSHRSRLVQILRDGHENVQLSPEEFDRIVSWIDISGPYYPDYGCAYPDNLAGRSPLSDQQLQRLGQLTSIDFENLASFARNAGPAITFDRPEASPCLARIQGITSPQYREALAIIQAGHKMLHQHPRAEMPGFSYCAKHQKRNEKYLRLRQEEQNRCQAISKDKRLFDARPVD